MEIELENAKIVCMDETVYNTGIKPGELYMAKRNTGWKLLTCRDVSYGANRCGNGNEKFFCEHHPENGHIDVVFPQENAYPFDSWECFKVLDIN